MISVRPVTSADFGKFFPMLDALNPEIGEQGWRRIFDYSWKRDETHCGFGLFDEEKAVGFSGFVFSERTISGKTVHFCNLTTWIVKQEYRGHSISLLMPIRKLKKHTLTDWTAGKKVAKMLARFGFENLDTSVRVLLPVWGKVADPRVRIFMDDAIEKLPLSATDRRIFLDHRPYPNCHQMALKDDEEYSHIIYTLNHDPALSFCHIHSISNLNLFERHHVAIRKQIMRKSQLPLILIDTRLLKSVKMPFSYQLPLRNARIYRSFELEPHQIDSLYSELTLLEFSTADCLDLGIREKLLALLTRLRRKCFELRQ